MPFPTATIDYDKATVLRAKGLDWSEIYHLVGAKNPESLRVGMYKRGTSALINSPVPDSREGEERALEKASLRVKKNLAVVVERQSSALAKSLNRLNDIRSSGKLEGLARVASTVADTATKVFGWDRGSGSIGEINLNTTVVLRTAPNQPRPEIAGPVVEVSEVSDGPAEEPRQVAETGLEASPVGNSDCPIPTGPQPGDTTPLTDNGLKK